MSEVRTQRGQPEVAAGDAARDLANDPLILRLHFTPNHLSRWLTPIHDQSRLARALHRGEPSVKELLLLLRDEELRVFPKMHEIAVRNTPNLDRLPPVERSAGARRWDEQAAPLEVMAEFRRLRQSTCSLLRALPDGAWERVGRSRTEGDWTLRRLAEHLVDHDEAVLTRMDRVLERGGVRSQIATVSRAPAEELFRLAPTRINEQRHGG